MSPHRGTLAAVLQRPCNSAEPLIDNHLLPFLTVAISSMVQQRRKVAGLQVEARVCDNAKTGFPPACAPPRDRWRRPPAPWRRPPSGAPPPASPSASRCCPTASPPHSSPPLLREARLLLLRSTRTTAIWLLFKQVEKVVRTCSRFTFILLKVRHLMGGTGDVAPTAAPHCRTTSYCSLSHCAPAAEGSLVVPAVGSGKVALLPAAALAAFTRAARSAAVAAAVPEKAAAARG